MKREQCTAGQVVAECSNFARITGIAGITPIGWSGWSGWSGALSGTAAIWLLLILAPAGRAQQQSSPSTPQTLQTPQQQVQQLAAAIAKAQAQVEASQQQLVELQRQLNALQQQLSTGSEAPPTVSPATLPTASTTASITASATMEELSEQQAMQAAEIATLAQSKVESDSKYPVKLSGLILLNGFVNTGAVDTASAPTFALSGTGSTGASLRQTLVGIDARGPHLGSAISHADLRVDFFGNPTLGGYGTAGGLLRLRTAHAVLDWRNTEAFIELDRPILSPNAPTSLTAVAVPALGGSGNLWNWIPQIGVAHNLAAGPDRIRLQAAVADVPDPPPLPGATGSPDNLSRGERSRWPASEARFSILGKSDGAGPEFGVGGYLSPHETYDGSRFRAWAGTLDMRLPLPARLELSGSFYRGQALGGLGSGAYQDYVYAMGIGGGYARALDDVGGWTQLKERAGRRFELNAALGLDNLFAGQLRPYANPTPGSLQVPARNQTFFTNAIYSPSAYLLFSVEYRRIATAPVLGPTSITNVVGIAAGYKF